MFGGNEDDGNRRRLQDFAAIALSHSGYSLGMQHSDHSVINMEYGTPNTPNHLSSSHGANNCGDPNAPELKQLVTQLTRTVLDLSKNITLMTQRLDQLESRGKHSLNSSLSALNVDGHNISTPLQAARTAVTTTVTWTSATP